MRDAERTRRRELGRNYNKIEKRLLPPEVTEAIRVWLAKRVALAESSRETYEPALKRVRALLGTKLACEPGATDIASYQKARLALESVSTPRNSDGCAPKCAPRGRCAKIAGD